MSFKFLEIELRKHAQSWIGLLSFNDSSNLFYVAWNYDGQIENIQILFVFDWYIRR